MFPAGSDYNSTVQPLEFLTGDTQLPLNITIVDDNVLEETESFTVRLILTARDINVILGPSNITRVVIRDNDGEKEVNGSLSPRPSSLCCAVVDFVNIIYVIYIHVRVYVILYLYVKM